MYFLGKFFIAKNLILENVNCHLSQRINFEDNISKLKKLFSLMIIFSISSFACAEEPAWKMEVYRPTYSTCPGRPALACPPAPIGNLFRQIDSETHECVIYSNGAIVGTGSFTNSRCEYAPAPPISIPVNSDEPDFHEQLNFTSVKSIYTHSTCPDYPNGSCPTPMEGKVSRKILSTNPAQINALCEWYEPNHQGITAKGYVSFAVCQEAQIKYFSAVPPTSSPPQCPALAGNPIDTSTGAKIQKETDIYSRGINQVGFYRTYSNGNKSADIFWFNLYQKSLQVIKPEEIGAGWKKSSPFASKSQACTSGWNEIKSNISEGWAQGTTAQYVNDTCQVKRHNVIVRSLPILPNINSLHISLKPSTIQLVREDGSILGFGLSTNNQYRSLNGERGQLTYVDQAPIAWRFRTSNSDIEDYNAEGKLLSITANNGMKQELFYGETTGLLSRVKDATGRELLFAYAGNQLSSVTVDGNKTTSYTYNASGLITQVIRPDNTTRIYHYEDSRFPTALTGITDERGARYATWTYDAQGRAISSEHAGGAEKTLLAFNADGSTTVTNALNKQTIYHFADIASVRRVTKVEGQPAANCAGANQNYTYTPEGWIESKADWKGIKTTYQYNSLGQEISRTEAFATPEARAITTEWHPTLYLKTKITEPEKETIYNYDENGRLLNQSTHSITVQ